MQLLNPEEKIGIGFSWDLDIFPYLWFWCVYGKFQHTPGGIGSIVWHWSHGQASQMI